MIRGRLAVHRTFWGTVFAGWSVEHLWWQPSDDPFAENELKILGSKQRREAYRCRGRELLIVPGIERE